MKFSETAKGGYLICLQATNLKKCYHDSDQLINVLNGVDISIASGELVSVTGKSGCGKSTLLHLLGLLDSPDDGSIRLFDSPVSSKMKEAPAIRNRDLGFVFQFHYLIDDLNAVQNVALPLLIAGNSQKHSLDKAAELLSGFNMSHRLKHYPSQLSGGEQQRIALARALINDPKIVFADEPTGNLDPQHSMEVWDLICRLNSDRMQTFVIVTHDHSLANMAQSRYELTEGLIRKLN